MDKHTVINMLSQSAISYTNRIPVCGKYENVFVESIRTDTECFVRKVRDHVTIVFRGTDSQKNWINNLCFCKKTIPDREQNKRLKVHKGFLEGYESVRQKIRNLIPEEVCKIKVAGHSLGAALAILCALDLKSSFKNADLEVYLFGCPRVGNKEFAKAYNKYVFKTLRIVNGNDIVTKLPPVFLGYKHVGILIHTGASPKPAIISFSDHTPQSYFSSLWKQL